MNAAYLIWIWIFSRQGPQTGPSHRRAVVCEQLAQGCYLRVQWLRSLGLTREGVLCGMRNFCKVYFAE